MPAKTLATENYMNDICKKCNQPIECDCSKIARLHLALNSLNSGLMHLSTLGYQPKDKIEFIKVNNNV